MSDAPQKSAKELARQIVAARANAQNVAQTPHKTAISSVSSTRNTPQNPNEKDSRKASTRDVKTSRNSGETAPQNAQNSSNNPAHAQNRATRNSQNLRDNSANSNFLNPQNRDEKRETKTENPRGNSANSSFSNARSNDKKRETQTGNSPNRDEKSARNETESSANSPTRTDSLAKFVAPTNSAETPRENAAKRDDSGESSTRFAAANDSDTSHFPSLLMELEAEFAPRKTPRHEISDAATAREIEAKNRVAPTRKRSEKARDNSDAPSQNPARTTAFSNSRNDDSAQTSISKNASDLGNSAATQRDFSPHNSPSRNNSAAPQNTAGRDDESSRRNSTRNGEKSVKSSTRNMPTRFPKTTDAATLRTQARLAALRALAQSETVETPLSALLDAQNIDGATRAFAREIATGTVRNRARIDWTLAPLLKKALVKLDAPVRNALRLAAYERLVLDTPHAVIADEYAGLMREEKLKSAVAFVNAVARRLPENWRESPAQSKNAATFLAIEYSHPRWLVERWLQRFGFEKCRDLCRANNEIAPLSLRVNTLKTSRERVLETLRERDLEAFAGEISPDAILVEGTPGSPENWPEWTRGEIIAQDEAAQIVAYVVAPKSGDFVVDVAAAPGGKTTHIAQLINDTGRVLACDRSEGRLKLVRQNANRLALSCVETDALDLLEEGGAVDFWDALLLDAPCSGTGTLRRRPDAKWRKNAAQIVELAALQTQLLDSAAKLVRVGGALVYSTCSLETEENEAQATAFLARHANWILDTETEINPEIAKLRGADGFWRTIPHFEYSISEETPNAHAENVSIPSAEISRSTNENAQNIAAENSTNDDLTFADAPIADVQITKISNSETQNSPISSAQTSNAESKNSADAVIASATDEIPPSANLQTRDAKNAGIAEKSGDIEYSKRENLAANGAEISHSRPDGMFAARFRRIA